MSTRLEIIGAHFHGFEQNCSGYVAHCPMHDDEHPSLSINEGEGGRILIKCHAGCETHSVVEAAGLRMRDLMPDAKLIEKTYDYPDEQGDLLYQVVRFWPKDFRQRRPKEGGGWDWSTKGVRRVLYRLRELLAAKKSHLVFVVAGEKDADNLAALGFVATTCVGGEGNGKWLDDYNGYLEGFHVVVLPDNDPTGWDDTNNQIYVNGLLQTSP